MRAEDRLGDGKWATSEARCWFTKEMKGCMIGAMYVGTRAGNRAERRGYFAYNAENNTLQNAWVDDEYAALMLYEGQKVGDDIVLDCSIAFHMSTATGKFTLTLRKDKSGRWLIVSDMDNSNRR